MKKVRIGIRSKTETSSHVGIMIIETKESAWSGPISNGDILNLLEDLQISPAACDMRVEKNHQLIVELKNKGFKVLEV